MHNHYINNSGGIAVVCGGGDARAARRRHHLVYVHRYIYAKRIEYNRAASTSNRLYKNQKALIDPNDFAMMKIDIFLGNILVAH